MATRGIALMTGSSMTAGSGSSLSTSTFWYGGRSVFVCTANQYSAAFSFQFQVMNGAWLNINSANITADTATNYDLPAGLYRVTASGGSSQVVYASIVSIPYY